MSGGWESSLSGDQSRMVKPSCLKWSSLVRTSVIASWRMTSMEMQSVRLYSLSGRAVFLVRAGFVERKTTQERLGRVRVHGDGWVGEDLPDEGRDRLPHLAAVGAEIGQDLGQDFLRGDDAGLG